MALLGRLELPLTHRHGELQTYLMQMRSALPHVEVVNGAESTTKLILQVVETAGSGVLLADWNWRATYANSAIEKFLAKQPSKVLGRRIWDLLPQSFVAALEERVAASKGVQSEIETEFFDENSSRWVQLNAFARDEGVAVFISHITKRKQAEESRKKSESRFRLLAENAQDMVFLYGLSPSPRFDYMSPACVAMTGQRPEAYYSNSELLLERLHLEDRAAFRQMCAENRPSSSVFRVMKADGEVTLIDLRITPVLDGKGRTIAIEGVARDISGQKTASAELAQSELLYRTTVNALPDGIFQVSPDGTLLQILGRYDPDRYGPKDALIGKKIEQILPGDAGRESAELVRLALYSRKTQRCEFDLNFGGRRRGIEARFVPSSSDCVLIVLRDVSDRMEAQTALHEANRKLQQSRLRIVRAQEEIRRSMADQLHGTVQSKLLVAARTLQDALQKESSAEIKKDIASVHALIEEAYKNDVRGIVKQLHPAAIRFGLLPGLRSLVETAGGPFEARLVYDEQDKDLQSLLTDGLSENVRLGIYRVVEESLNNIAKHSRATHVTATLTVEPGQYMVVAIKDNGEGFDEKMVPPGYGLVAMEDHCTSLGGEFAVRSAPGQGTLVRASFPIARAKP